MLSDVEQQATQDNDSLEKGNKQGTVSRGFKTAAKAERIYRKHKSITKNVIENPSGRTMNNDIRCKYTSKERKEEHQRL